MRAVVTGAAGFVGSHLSAKLLGEGARVVGIDALTDYYDVTVKRRNVARLRQNPRFAFVEGDLVQLPISELVEGADAVFHLAGQPGVRASWGDDFADYVHHNVFATQRLLDACKDVRLGKLVYASSSSVYGDSEAYPTSETLRPAPVSPYGVTKLAAEHLVEVYRRNFGVPSVSLRLFTVYGPGQRPDMAFSRLVRAALTGTEFGLFGDGEQTRDFTFVNDVVAGMLAAASSQWCGVANIGGGSRTSMNRVIEIVTGLCGAIDVRRGEVARGDVRHTSADISVAARCVGYHPRTPLAEGLAAMVAAERAVLAVLAP
jgi:nucleoside-diphosphate-sugar epimerase